MLYPDMDELIRRARAQTQRDSAGAVQVLQNPPSLGAGVIGNQRLVSVPDGVYSPRTPDTGNLIEVANWQGAPDVHTLPLTITFAPVEPLSIYGINAGGNQPFFRPFGVVQFGTKGSMYQAYVDIGMGTQFTVSGSSCRLLVGLPPSVAAAQHAGSMTLAGSISCRPIAKNDAPATRSVYFDVGTNGGTFVYPIPRFARSLTFLKAGPTTDGAVISFLNNFGASAGAVLVLPANANSQLSNQQTPVLIPGEAVAYTLQKIGALTDSPTGTMIFGLSF